MKNRIAVVSGGTKGIGKSICTLLLENNFTVYTSARKIDVDFLHPNLFLYQADLSDKLQVKDFANFVMENVDYIDILVNNVGVFLPGKITEEDEGNFEKQINTNLASTYHLTRSTIELIKQSDKPYIFNICSTASVTPYLNGGSYCISKYAQLGLTKVLREELKEYNIKVSAVMPGATLTDSWAGTELSVDRFSNPESIAQLILTAYKLPDSTVMEEIVVRPLAGDIT